MVGLGAAHPSDPSFRCPAIAKAPCHDGWSMGEERTLDDFFDDDADAASESGGDGDVDDGDIDDGDIDDDDVDDGDGDAADVDTADVGSADVDTADTDATDIASDEIDRTDADESDLANTGEPIPAVATYSWHPDGATCEICETTVERRWLDDGAYVCADCKKW